MTDIGLGEAVGPAKDPVRHRRIGDPQQIAQFIANGGQQGGIIEIKQRGLTTTEKDTK